MNTDAKSLGQSILSPCLSGYVIFSSFRSDVGMERLASSFFQRWGLIEGWDRTIGQAEGLKGWSERKKGREEGLRDRGCSAWEGDYLCVLGVMEPRHHQTMSRSRTPEACVQIEMWAAEEAKDKGELLYHGRRGMLQMCLEWKEGNGSLGWGEQEADDWLEGWHLVGGTRDTHSHYTW